MTEEQAKTKACCGPALWGLAKTSTALGPHVWRGGTRMPSPARLLLTLGSYRPAGAQTTYLGSKSTGDMARKGSAGGRRSA